MQNVQGNIDLLYKKSPYKWTRKYCFYVIVIVFIITTLSIHETNVAFARMARYLHFRFYNEYCCNGKLDVADFS